MIPFNAQTIHPSWQSLVAKSLQCVDPNDLAMLTRQNDWLPGPDKIFNAFTLPRPKTRYILFGESPYPRAVSANGYAFWDAAVTDLWSASGLSLQVNRATSLRNLIKTLLVAEGLLSPLNTTQAAIAALDKSQLVSSIADFFNNFLKQGFLLLNTTLVLHKGLVRQDAAAWRPFVDCFLTNLGGMRQRPELILWGNVAKALSALPAALPFQCRIAEHPYQISFIHNKGVLDFFKPLHLLRKRLP